MGNLLDAEPFSGIDGSARVHRITLGGNTHQFDNLATLLAKATPLRSGDQLAGLAAASTEERAAAQMCLAETPLSEFLAEPKLRQAWSSSDTGMSNVGFVINRLSSALSC